VATALSLILLSLGTGLGFSAVSPWSNNGASASAIGSGAIAWLILTQIVASALGGYLGGRLRTKWAGVHTDEVYFRDTAHGLLVWAVGMVITAGFLASAAASFAGAQRNAVATNPTQDSALDSTAYFVDTLLRADVSAIQKADAPERAEASRIFTHDLHQGALPNGDKTYLAQLVAARTGLNPPDAEKRVTDVFGDAQDSIDRVRKAIAHLSLWLFVALLSGAFCASYAGTIGGKQRDHLPI
jgi:MFS family permease